MMSRDASDPPGSPCLWLLVTEARSKQALDRTARHVRAAALAACEGGPRRGSTSASHRRRGRWTALRVERRAASEPDLQGVGGASRLQQRRSARSWRPETGT